MAEYFSFQLPDSLIRGMNRKRYKAVTHWARFAARDIDKRIDWDKVSQHVSDIMLYGRSEIDCADMLR